METITFSAKDVELVVDENLTKEAFASFSNNPNVTWAKFVLLDDQANGNKQRIPQEEFDNIIRTGKFMPLKSRPESIAPDHKDAKPLGVITHLKKEENTVIGLAALWIKERKDDIASIKELFSKKGSVNVSWEVSYGDSEFDLETGVKTLKDVIMNAVTIVGIPAYQGRTPIVALASMENKSEENMETIPMTEHEEIVNQLKEKIKELETLKEEVNTELASLREFKETKEAEEQKLQKLSELKEKFASAGLELTEDYLTENETKLLSMTPEVLDFFVQELVSFKSAKNESTSSLVVTSKVPNLDGQKDTKNDKSLAERARELDARK